MNEQDYLDVLKELISRASETILILHALDECVGNEDPDIPDKGFEEVQSIFDKLLSSKLRVKIVVSSRPHLRAIWSNPEIIEISPKDNAQDIRTMIQTLIQKQRQGDKNKEDPKITVELEERCVDLLTSKSQGM